MTPEARMSAVAEFGFTPRQARFLVLVMRHAGVCLLRQYSTFAGIVQGQKTRAFFRKLVDRGFASSYGCRHNRGRLYHVHHTGLYRAIGEANSAYRRPVTAGRVAERLMMLDALLMNPDVAWLATTSEKVAHFTSEPCSGPPEWLPRSAPISTALASRDPFRDRLPIGLSADRRTVFLYLVLPAARDDFRAFLRGHAALLEALPSWTLRVAVPRDLAGTYDGIQSVVREEFESPLQARTIDDLRWYFERLRASRNGSVRPVDERSLQAAEAFERPRFYALYRQWLKDGDRALDRLSSTAIGDALATGVGRVECHVLPHRYDHLSPLVAVVGSRVHGAEKGAEDHEQRGERTTAPPRPQSADSVVEAIESARIDRLAASASPTS